MHNEIQIALEFLISFLHNKIPRNKVSIFTDNLTNKLLVRFNDHWYPNKPGKGSAYRCITIGSNKIDEVVRDAAIDSGIDVQNIQSAFSNDISMWIDPNEVSYRIGDGIIKVLYNFNTISPPLYDYNNLGGHIPDSNDPTYYGDTPYTSHFDSNLMNLFGNSLVDNSMFNNVPSSFDSKSGVFDLKSDAHPYSYFNGDSTALLPETISFSDNSLSGSSNQSSSNNRRPLSNSPTFLNKHIFNNYSPLENNEVNYSNNMNNTTFTPPPYFNNAMPNNNNQYHNAHQKNLSKSYSTKKYHKNSNSCGGTGSSNSSSLMINKRITSPPNNNKMNSKYNSSKKGLHFSPPNDNNYNNNNSYKFDQIIHSSAFLNNNNNFVQSNNMHVPQLFDNNFSQNYSSNNTYSNGTEGGAYDMASCFENYSGYNNNHTNNNYHNDNNGIAVFGSSHSSAGMQQAMKNGAGLGDLNMNDIDLVISRKLQNLLVAN